MSLVGGNYGHVEEYVYDYLTGTMKFNRAVACGILANIAHEAGTFNPTTTNSIGAYGLCQWLGSRKTNLQKKSNYNTVATQMEFMREELNSTEKKTMNYLKEITQDTLANARYAARIFSIHFERHGEGEAEHKEREATAEEYYYYYSEYTPTPGDNPGAGGLVLNLGQLIVNTARSLIKEENNYDFAGIGPDKFDSPGLVYYCYNTNGYPIDNLHAQAYYDTYKSKSKSIARLEDACAGDLVFIFSDSNSEYATQVYIATGDGYLINSNPEFGVSQVDPFGIPISSIIRILADSQTSQGEIPKISNNSTGVVNYYSVASNDPYVSYIAQNLERMTYADEENKFGYLFDVTHGNTEAFKFYIPEFSEQAGANWRDISIIGRSVTIKAYEDTNSRSITINLDLYAGVGIYDRGVDPVGALHRDALWLRSLEYPDYTNPIIRPPATVNLILGSSVNILGVVSEVSIEHKKPLDSQGRSMYLTVSFRVTQTAVNPPDYTDIRLGQYALAGSENISTLYSGGITTEKSNSSNVQHWSGSGYVLASRYENGIPVIDVDDL